MYKKRSDKEFIVDMYLACQKILDYTKGMAFDDFTKDDKTIDAVIRNLEILGEAVKNTTQYIREKYPDIEWSKLARMRDKLIHFYFGVNYSIVWKIITMDIPVLFEKLRHIIEQEEWKNELE